jgi:nicotinamide mononucleotide adenylyltransferase
MITKILNALGVKFTIYSVPDMEKDDDRREYIINNLPKFDAVISGNPLTTSIFKKIKYAISNIKTTKDIKATAIRHMIHI